MACLLGYSANASAIQLYPGQEPDSSGPETALRVVRLLRRVDAGVGYDNTPIHAAAAFWLIIKLTRGECLRSGPYSLQ